jgi:peptidoglycan hydrolase-like protein with peptidoglycan-binding domain
MKKKLNNKNNKKRLIYKIIIIFILFFNFLFILADDKEQGKNLDNNVKVTINNPSLVIEDNNDKKNNSKNMGSSGKATVYTCRDESASNFSLRGRHRQDLCIFADNEIFQVVDNLLFTEGKNIFIDKVRTRKKSNNWKSKFTGVLCENEKILTQELKDGDKDDAFSSVEDGVIYEIKTLQKRLIELGYNPGLIDGIFGSVTKQAVLRAQKNFRIKEDGFVGPVTRLSLNNSCVRNNKKKVSEKEYEIDNEVVEQYEEYEENKIIEVEENSETCRTDVLINQNMESGDKDGNFSFSEGHVISDVRNLQEFIYGLGFFVGPIDGFFGIKTETGVKKIQEYFEINVTGIVGTETRLKINQGCEENKNILEKTKKAKVSTIKAIYETIKFKIKRQLRE